LRFGGTIARLLHTTIARNRGGDGSGVYVEAWEELPSNVALTNTILISHSVGISVTSGSTVTINGILWYNTLITISKSVTAVVTVNNQFTGDPAFVDPAAEDYHIGPGSAAIDRGVDAGVTTDIDGDARPAPPGTRPDLGADEVSQRRVYLPLVLCNQ
jgi:hypothetical protein